MNQKLTNKIRKYLQNHKPKYHLVTVQSSGRSPKYNGEYQRQNYVHDIANEVLGKDYLFNSQSDASVIIESLEVHPSALVIPQGYADINVLPNLYNHFGITFPKIPIFYAKQHTGNYCYKDGALKNSDMKKEKDEFVQSAYRKWLLDSVKPNPLNLSYL